MVHRDSPSATGWFSCGGCVDARTACDSSLLSSLVFPSLFADSVLVEVFNISSKSCACWSQPVDGKSALSLLSLSDGESASFLVSNSDCEEIEISLALPT